MPQLNELLYCFIQKHHVSLLGPATQYIKNEDCRTMFQSLVNAVDPALDKSRVEKASLQKTKRSDQRYHDEN